MSRQGEQMLRGNMVTAGIDFSHVNLIGSYLFLTHGSSGAANMRRPLKAFSNTGLT